MEVLGVLPKMQPECSPLRYFIQHKNMVTFSSSTSIYYNRSS